MSTDNVTPIRPTGPPPPKPPKARRQRSAKKKPPGLVLRESDEDDGFTTADLLNALHGCILAVDMKLDDTDIDSSELALAAKILVCVLRDRQVDGP